MPNFVVQHLNFYAHGRVHSFQNPTKKRVFRMVALNESSFEKICSLKSCIIYFFGKTCSPCKRASFVLSEFEKKFSGIKIFKIDVDENPNLASRFSVQAIPTVFVMKNGKINNQIDHVTLTALEKYAVNA